MTAMLTPEQKDDLLNYDEVRAELDGKVTDRTIARYAQRGRITRVRIGRSTFITRASLDRFKAELIRQAEVNAVRTARASRK